MPNVYVVLLVGVERTHDQCRPPLLVHRKSPPLVLPAPRSFCHRLSDGQHLHLPSVLPKSGAWREHFVRNGEASPPSFLFFYTCVEARDSRL